jgi:hypothetical protein
MMEIDLKKFEKAKAIAEENYKTIGKVHCPYLNDDVSFNSKGLDHIKLKGWNKARLVSDQFLRLKFLKLAPEIIKKSHTLQEYKETKNFERMKISSRWENKMVLVRYYGFVSVCGECKDVRVKIIVKEIEGNGPYFWSIIPFWKNDNHPLLKQIKKAFHEGNLEIE